MRDGAAIFVRVRGGFALGAFLLLMFGYSVLLYLWLR